MKTCIGCLEDKPDSEFYKRQGKPVARCKDCTRERQRQWYSEIPPEARRAKYQKGRDRAGTSIARVTELKRAPCADCKKRFDPVCMDFDHVRGKKESNVSRLLVKGASWARIQAEIDKCDLVCANCHRLRTKKRWLEKGRDG